MKKIVSVFTITALVTSAASAGNYYAAAKVGYNLNRISANEDASGTGFCGNNNECELNDVSPSFMIAVGKTYATESWNLPIELELGYGKTDVGRGVEYQRIANIMFNGYAQYKLYSWLVPYAGIGIGFSNQKVNDIATGNQDASGGMSDEYVANSIYTRNVPAGQFMIGAEIPLTENFAFDIGFRFVRYLTSDIDIHSQSANSTKQFSYSIQDTISTNAVYGGVKYTF